MATSTLTAVTWDRERAAPVAGGVGLLADPVPGYQNALKVHKLDRFGNDRTAQLATIQDDDVLLVSAGARQLHVAVNGTPSVASSVYNFPFIVSQTFVAKDEPADGKDCVVFQVVVVDWPETDELAQVLNVENVTDWETTLDRVLAAAIDAVKGQVGNWDDQNDRPDDNLAAAALRLAELMSLRPEATTRSLMQDPGFRAYMTGRHRKVQIA